MFFFFPHTYCPMACIKWVLPRPTPPYTKRGLYVRAGACATARLAACAISLFGPTTNDSNVFRGLSPGTVAPGYGLLGAACKTSSRGVRPPTDVAVPAPVGKPHSTERGLPNLATIALCTAVTHSLSIHNWRLLS